MKQELCSSLQKLSELISLKHPKSRIKHPENHSSFSLMSALQGGRDLKRKSPFRRLAYEKTRCSKTELLCHWCNTHCGQTRFLVQRITRLIPPATEATVTHFAFPVFSERSQFSQGAMKECSQEKVLTPHRATVLEPTHAAGPWEVPF